MRFTSHTTSDGVTQRDFVLGDVPGTLWTPAGDPTGLVLSAHGGGQHKHAPGMIGRAHRCARAGLAVVTLDAPGHGNRARSADDERFAAEIRSLVAAGHNAGPVVARYNALQASRAIPEWQSVLDALLGSEVAVGDRVGFWGVSMGSAVGIPLLAAEPASAAPCSG
ncbi:hypothetical protein [Lentzea sp. NPDC003310]|uniref:alpha/beta hydrolase family protein n=1 Tax=Lentzea sp. NPDC003310 TaxID=3154447 RepID=UPI0033A5B8A0